MNLTIIYEDNHLIVCLKPSGILSQAGDMKELDMVNIIKDYLKDKYHKPGNVYLGLVHRLDLNVSGIMVFAKTSKAAKRLSEQIRNHNFSKKYLAISKGKFNNRNGELKNYIIKDNKQRQAFLSNSVEGKLAQLNYQVLDENIINKDIYSLLDIELITGRFHQIRFQLAYNNHPLYGDTKYGSIVKNRNFFLGLYAYQIEFTHPTTKENMLFNLKPSHQLFLNFNGLDKIKWR